jgi:hypothetical protein
MEFGGAAIAVAALRLCGKPVTQQFSRQPDRPLNWAEPSQDPSFDTGTCDAIGIINALTNLAHTRWRGLVDSKIRSHVGYSDWTLTTEPSERRAPYDRPDTGAYLIVISLLSLGIWAGIWAIFASFASAVLG